MHFPKHAFGCRNVLDHLQASDRLESPVRERKALGIGKYGRRGTVESPSGRREVQRDVISGGINVAAEPAIRRPDVQHIAPRRADTARRPPRPQEPLRMKSGTGKTRYPAPQPPHLSLLRLYVSEVICSDTRPIRKTMTDALSSNALMLVNRCWVVKV